MRYTKARHKGQPGVEYYYRDRKGKLDRIPEDGEEIEPPELDQLKDEHRAHPGGMKNLRTQPQDEQSGLNSLLYAAHAREMEQKFPSRKTMGPGPMRVKQNIPRRDAEYKRVFKRATGLGSAKDYDIAEKTNAGVDMDLVPDEIRPEISHLNGLGQVGREANRTDNLPSASRGANSQMIPFDNAASGNPQLMMDTTAETFGDTRITASITQRVRSAEFPGMVLARQDVHGQRPPYAPEEWDEDKNRYGALGDIEAVNAMVGLELLKRGGDRSFNEDDAAAVLRMPQDETRKKKAKKGGGNQ